VSFDLSTVGLSPQLSQSRLEKIKQQFNHKNLNSMSKDLQNYLSEQMSKKVVRQRNVRLNKYSRAQSMVQVKHQSSLPEINTRYEDLRIDMSKERYDPYSDMPATQFSGYSKNV
jgi:hypothetical protein